MTDTILVERPQDGTALITLNRPEKLNALNISTFQRLDEVLTELEADDSVRVVVLTGTGKAFSAGYDVREMEGLDEAATLLDYQTREPWMFHLADLAKPVVAAVNGLAYGGGALLASCADIRIGCAGSRFKITAVPYGGINGSWNFPLIVGWGKTKEWLLTGRVIEPEEALASGLLNHIVPDDEVLPRALETAATIASYPPAAVQGLKSVLHANVGRSLADSYNGENTYLHTKIKFGRTSDLFSNFLNK
ncbi:MAG TPA: enoyl-CoA hydratase/isomerase family protein [Ilumatobacteraceae bacterium]|nr:enoyl-CoA hydratase/isomerase family protein [Ilumatobacteraceae bacterium]